MGSRSSSEAAASKEGHAHTHGHSHGAHDHGHSHGNDWTPDFPKWENEEKRQQNMQKMVKRVVSLFDEVPENMQILDFGCGNSMFARKLLETGGEGFVGNIGNILCADVDKRFLDYSKKKIDEELSAELASKCSYLLMNSLDGRDVAIPKLKGKMDLVICSLVLGHITSEAIPTVIKNICSALKPGGILVISEFDAVSKQHEGHDMNKDKFVSDGGLAHTTVSREQVESWFEEFGMESMPEKHDKYVLTMPHDLKAYDVFVMVAKRKASL